MSDKKEKPSITEAMQGLRDLCGHHFDGIDVEASVSELRGHDTPGEAELMTEIQRLVEIIQRTTSLRDWLYGGYTLEDYNRFREQYGGGDAG